jgi:MoxR-like ATPase
MATQNPIEQEGTYPLPEAQMDRFMLKVRVYYPDRQAERAILDRMTEGSLAPVKPVADAKVILAARELLAHQLHGPVELGGGTHADRRLLQKRRQELKQVRPVHHHPPRGARAAGSLRVAASAGQARAPPPASTGRPSPRAVATPVATVPAMIPPRRTRGAGRPLD